MAKKNQPAASLYVKLLIGTLSFLALVQFLFLHVTRPGITVPPWVFIILMAIMGSCIGIDILDQYRGAS